MLIFYTLLLVTFPTDDLPNENSDSSMVELESVEETVEKWIKASRKAGPKQGSFHVFTYDHVFKTEKRGNGQFYIIAPDQWRVVINADTKMDVESSEVKGETYTLTSMEPRELIRVKTQFYTQGLSDLSTNTTSEGLLERFFVESLFEFISPQAITMFPDTFRDQLMNHKIEYGTLNDPSIHLILYPIEADTRRMYLRFEVLLNRESYLPKAIKIQDPTGNKTTVYVINEFETNSDIPESTIKLTPSQLSQSHTIH